MPPVLRPQRGRGTGFALQLLEEGRRDAGGLTAVDAPQAGLAHPQTARAETRLHGRLKEDETMDEPHNSVLTIILGGGRGTRLFPLTQYRCKPAVPLVGSYRLVDIPISNCLNAGYYRIFVLTQFLTASLHRHIHASFQFDPFSGGFVEILAAEQTDHSTDWYQGTADAVRRNLQHFAPHAHELVLILPGDQLYRMDFRHLVAQHVATGADVTVAATPVPVSRVAGLGLLRVAADRSIAAIVEKPTDPVVIQGLTLPPAIEATLAQPSAEPRCLASMGIYVFNRTVLQAALDTPMTDFGQEIIPSLGPNIARLSFGATAGALPSKLLCRKHLWHWFS